MELRLYSGSSGGLRGPALNYVPVTLADIRLEPGASIEQDLAASYNGFLYILEGEAMVGEDGVKVGEGEVGWLDRSTVDGAAVLRIAAGATGARAVLYAGEPQNDPIVLHGPFAANSREEIMELYQDARAGRFPRMSEISPDARAASLAVVDRGS